MTNSLVQVLCNASLQHYGGDLYVGVMTVINSIREVVSMPVQGITNGCQPVLGYNYGAGEYERVRRGIRFTTVLTVGYSVAAWALVMAVPELLIRIFNDEPELIAAGIPAFRLYFAAFFCMSFQFIGQSVFVGLGRSKSAVFFSLLRKAFIVAPLTLLLPGFSRRSRSPTCSAGWPACSPCISRSTGVWAGKTGGGFPKREIPPSFFARPEIFPAPGGYSQ